MQKLIQKFWLVWREGTVPQFRHISEESARAEAERLCLQTGQKFLVLECKGEVEPAPKTVYNPAMRAYTDEGIAEPPSSQWEA